MWTAAAPAAYTTRLTSRPRQRHGPPPVGTPGTVHAIHSSCNNRQQAETTLTSSGHHVNIPICNWLHSIALPDPELEVVSFRFGLFDPEPINKVWHFRAVQNPRTKPALTCVYMYSQW